VPIIRKGNSKMPKLKEIEINYEQVRDLVYQLAFEKRIALIRDIVKDKSYQEEFYRFTESLTKKYAIPEMTESELDSFLHQ
jgi:hypothetical protein